MNSILFALQLMNTVKEIFYKYSLETLRPPTNKENRNTKDMMELVLIVGILPSSLNDAYISQPLIEDVWACTHSYECALFLAFYMI